MNNASSKDAAEKFIPQLSIKIPLDEYIDDEKLKPLNVIFEQVVEELNELNISVIVDEYQKTVSEFLCFSKTERQKAPKYNDILERAINVINRIYFVEIKNIYVNASKYHTNVWGPLYWSLLHTMSILILHAFETKNINDFIRFSNNCISY